MTFQIYRAAICIPIFINEALHFSSKFYRYQALCNIPESCVIHLLAVSAHIYASVCATRQTVYIILCKYQNETVHHID
jgi:hypothetical protein